MLYKLGSFSSNDQIVNMSWIIEKAREFQKNIYFCFIDYTKTFDCVDHNKLWKILKEMGIPLHLTCLLRNLYASQEATVRTRHGTMDSFQIGKRVRQGCIWSPCLLNFYAESIMQNARLDEAKAGIKIAGEKYAGFRKGRGTRNQIANIRWILEKAREFQKSIYFWFIDYDKALVWNHNKLWKILKEMGIPDHLPCLLRNLYSGQEATVRTRHGTTDWFKIGKGRREGCILSPCLFNISVEYIMRNAGLEESQAGTKKLGEISITSDMQMTPPLWQKAKRN